MPGAEARANKMGVMVEKIEIVPGLKSAPSVPLRMARQNQLTLKGCQVICPNPNCGYRGPTMRVEKGSVVLGVLLMLFVFVIPGLLYLIFMCGSKDICPQCGIQVGKE